MRTMAVAGADAASTARRLAVGIAAGLFGLGLAANGIWMLADPAGWFQAVPGVADSGAYNAHFVRDVGMSYLGLGLAAGHAAWRPGTAPTILRLVALLLGLHAFLHVWDVAAARLPLAHLWIDLPGVFLPPLLALGLAALAAPFNYGDRS